MSAYTMLIIVYCVFWKLWIKSIWSDPSPAWAWCGWRVSRCLRLFRTGRWKQITYHLILLFRISIIDQPFHCWFNPSILELRSVDHIVLDCPYQLSSRGEAEGLVLKWCLPCFIFVNCYCICTGFISIYFCLCLRSNKWAYYPQTMWRYQHKRQLALTAACSQMVLFPKLSIVLKWCIFLNYKLS